MARQTPPIPALRAPFQDLARYATEEGRGAFLRMDFNEGPPPDLPRLARALALCASTATVYPEYGALRQAAAKAWDVAPEGVLPVNGADEGIALTVRAFTGPGAALAIPVPTFPMYRLYAEACGTPVLPVPLRPDFQVDGEALAAALPDAAMLALATPNNPTGRAVPEGDLVRLLEAARGLPVLLDETYAPFCGQDFAHLLARFSNLLVLRTLSKAHGLPGLRCGFLLGDARLIERLDALRSPFNVNGLAAALGALMLGEPGLRGRLARAVAARRRLQARLDTAGLRTVPSDTHFFLADLGGRAAAAVAALRASGILVKDLGRTLPGFLRISVAGDPEAERFQEAFLPWFAGGAR